MPSILFDGPHDDLLSDCLWAVAAGLITGAVPMYGMNWNPVLIFPVSE